MRELEDGIVYYSTGDISAYINLSYMTIISYDVLSNEMEMVNGSGSRLIPKALRRNGQRLWTREQVLEIKRFVDGKKWGDLARVRRELESTRVKGQDRQEQKQRWAVDQNMSTNKK